VHRALHRPTFRQLAALVRAERVLERDPGELMERVKCLCARMGWVYDSVTIRKAIDAVAFVDDVKRRARQRVSTS
jgi:hypothetical protein